MTKYKLTDEHRKQLNPWAKKWIDNAMSTRSIEKHEVPLIKKHVRGLYEAAGLTPPPDNRIIVVSSPFVARFAGGFASWIWNGREKTYGSVHEAIDEETRAATYEAINDAPDETVYAATIGETDAATLAAVDAATRDTVDAATDAAIDDETREATYAAVQGATSRAVYEETDEATYEAAYAAIDRAVYEATRRAVNEETKAATYAEIEGATSRAVEGATDAAVQAATTAEIDRATYEATYAAVEGATYEATDVATSAATDEATDETIDAATWAATYAVANEATREAVDAATYEATRDTVDAATWAETYAVANEATREAVDAATDATMKLDSWVCVNGDMVSCAKKFGNVNALLACAKKAHRMYQGGNLWSAWCGFISFFRHICNLDIDYSKWDHYEKLAELSGYRIVCEKFCIVSERPKVLLVDDQNRPHCEDGPFCIWRDGSMAFAIHGQYVPGWIVLTPEKITVKDIQEEQDLESQRIMVDRYGVDKYLAEIGAQVVDADMRGIEGGGARALLREENGRQWFFCTDGSTERIYHLSVSDEVKTCKAAHQELCGFDESKIKMEG